MGNVLFILRLIGQSAALGMQLNSSNDFYLSTGGLVLKQALVLALKMVGEQQGRNEQIRKKCSSIAFFGVPRKFEPSILKF